MPCISVKVFSYGYFMHIWVKVEIFSDLFCDGSVIYEMNYNFSYMNDEC
ncbi:hypothetical protein SAMN04488136_1586 [Vibrio xiamenensis]|uniref:Uncharacterized protein n=1 Tax=Vibrio xiamenensis TaxID=861298 RepID=A0A1G8HPA2_9VIBR|nr:hypothetical protein SAMN04488136_1586 [Vibrio xiamenensis]